MIGKRHLSQGAAGALLAAALLVLPAAPARAGDACVGQYMTSVMQQIPLPMKVTVAQPGNNPALAQQFLAGLQSAGAQIDPNSRFRLMLVFTVATAASGPMQGKVYNNFSWADEHESNIDLGSSIVNVTGQVMDTTTYSYVWIISAQCTAKVASGAAIAGEFGTLIGRTLGRDVPNGKF